MKSSTLKNTARVFALACLIALSIGSAQAGPGPVMTYAPVSTSEANAIKPGERIAIACGNCNTTTLYIAGDDRSYLKGYTCPTDGRQFVVREKNGRLEYVDSEGHVSRLLKLK